MPNQNSNNIDPLSVVKRGVKASEAISEPDDLDKMLKLVRITGVLNDQQLRTKYASQILWFLYVYSFVVVAIVIASDLQVRWAPFELPSEVLAILVGSTTVSAIGLVGFIARGLFNTPPSLGL